MARQQQGDGITGAGARHCARVAVQLAGQFGIAARLSAGNILQRLPDAQLKRRAAYVQWQMGGALRFCELLQHLLQPVTQARGILFELRCGKALLQFAAQVPYLAALGWGFAQRAGNNA